MRSFARRLALPALLVLGAVLPGLLHAGDARAGGGELTVAAAASLQDALDPVVRAFEQAEGTTVRVTYAGSGRIMAQIAAGAPIDVFLTARAEMLDEPAWKSRFVSRQPFASNRLVVVVPASSDAAPAALSDLTRSRYARIGIGNPGYVPAGTYARAALERAGLYAVLQRRFVMGEDVRQVLTYAERGEVDAAFVYRTDAAGRDRVRVAFEAPIPAGHAITYGAAVVAGSPHRALAEKFVAFLTGSRAEGMLREKGFGPAPGK